MGKIYKLKKYILLNMSFPIFSVKQPWAYAIVEKHQKVVNLPQKISYNLMNRWFALYCSNGFDHQDKNFKFDGIPSIKKLKRQCGKILGIIRFSAVVRRSEALRYDSMFTILLEKSDYFALISEMYPLVTPKIPSLSYLKYPGNITTKSSLNTELLDLSYSSISLNILSKSISLQKDLIGNTKRLNDNFTRKTNVLKEITKTLKKTIPKLFKSLPKYRKRLKRNIKEISKTFKNLPETQVKRFKSSCRAYIPQHLVRKIMASILKIDPQTIKKDILIFICGVAKLYLAQIIEISLCLQVEQNLNSFKTYDPLRPKHIREAIRKIERTKINNSLFTE